MSSFLDVHQIHAYASASQIADDLWKIISTWDSFNKQTLGVQYLRAIDSIAGNIAEGFGRFHKKDKQKFYYNARGSLYESIHWTEKAKERNLLSQQDFDTIMRKLNELPREINWLIKITEEKLTK